MMEGQVCLSTPTRIELAVELLKSNNSLVDAELRRKLEARKHPRIEGRLREAKPLPGSRCLLRGDLTLHGVSRLLEVEGEKTIDMRDFNLTPPRFLIFKVEPTVRIRAKLVAKRA